MNDRSRGAAFCLMVLTMLTLVSLGGCNPIENIKTKNRTAALDDAVDTYRKLIRWGYFEQATQYLKARDGSEQEPDIAELKRYKVTRYNIEDQWLADSEDEARVVAVIEFYDLDSSIARAFRDEQLWWYDWTAERWFLGTPMPDFASVR